MEIKQTYSFSFRRFIYIVLLHDVGVKSSKNLLQASLHRLSDLLTLVSFIFQRNNIAVLFLYPYEKMIYHKVSLNFLHIDIHLYFLLQLPARLLA